MDHCQNASEPDAAVDRPLHQIGTTAGKRRSADGPRESAADGPVADHGSGSATRCDLDAWADELRQRHLGTALATLERRNALDAGDRAAIAACSRAIVDELLRGPHRGLRTDAEEFGPAVAALFDLEE